jgi:small redox-active disulfide protein 2
MIKIEVFGPGCHRCHATKEAIRQAIEAAGVEATLTHISDPREIARNRVFFTPAVRIDGEMKSTGRVPSPDEVTKWLINRAAA